MCMGDIFQFIVILEENVLNQKNFFVVCYLGSYGCNSYYNNN